MKFSGALTAVLSAAALAASAGLATAADAKLGHLAPTNDPRHEVMQAFAQAVEEGTGGEVTMDLRIPHWPFLSAIVLGLVAALIMTLIRIWRIWRYHEDLEDYETIPEEAPHE